MTQKLRRITSILALMTIVLTFLSGSMDVEAKKKKATKTVAYDATYASSCCQLIDGNTVAFTAAIRN